MIQRDPEIAERYRRGRARAIGAVAQSLIARARNGDTASMVLLSQDAGRLVRDPDDRVHAAPSGEIELSGVARLRRMVEWIAERQGDRLIEGEAP